jgi:hypothetical protein
VYPNFVIAGQRGLLLSFREEEVSETVFFDGYGLMEEARVASDTLGSFEGEK